MMGGPHVKRLIRAGESDFSTSYKMLGPLAKLAISSLYAYGKFLDGFFCYLTCSMLENMSYGRKVTSGAWTSGTYNLVVTRTAFWQVWAECSKNGRDTVGEPRRARNFTP
jgi:hypothetical protein